MTENQRRVFDIEAERFGPQRNQSAADVAAKLERQIAMNKLVDELTEMLRKPGRTYDDPADYARQLACMIDAEFELKVRK